MESKAGKKKRDCFLHNCLVADTVQLQKEEYCSKDVPLKPFIHSNKAKKALLPSQEKMDFPSQKGKSVLGTILH